jgi:hypothetical protein
MHRHFLQIVSAVRLPQLLHGDFDFGFRFFDIAVSSIIPVPTKNPPQPPSRKCGLTEGVTRDRVESLRGQVRTIVFVLKVARHL